MSARSDTPRGSWSAACMQVSARVEDMPAIKGRHTRAANAPTVLLQARVDPKLREKAHRAAGALGISMASYMEHLLAHEELDANGRPVWWTDPAPADQEELPLSRSA